MKEKTKEEFLKLTKKLTDREFRLLCLFVLNFAKKDILENGLSTEKKIHGEACRIYASTNVDRIIDLANEAIFDDQHFYKIVGEALEKENTNPEGRVASYGI